MGWGNVGRNVHETTKVCAIEAQVGHFKPEKGRATS